MWIELKILKNRAKLERMIIDNEDYSKILKQSRKLDNYINIKLKQEKRIILNAECNSEKGINNINKIS